MTHLHILGKFKSTASYTEPQIHRLHVLHYAFIHISYTNNIIINNNNNHKVESTWVQISTKPEKSVGKTIRFHRTVSIINNYSSVVLANVDKVSRSPTILL